MSGRMRTRIRMVTVNVVVLAGTVAADPVERRMPSGDEVTELRLSVPEAGKRLLPLPVAVWHKDVGKRALKGIGKGDDVLVYGQLVRRFYRSGAGARSLTEVVATGIKKLEPPEEECRLSRRPAGSTGSSSQAAGSPCRSAASARRTSTSAGGGRRGRSPPGSLGRRRWREGGRPRRLAASDGLLGGDGVGREPERRVAPRRGPARGGAETAGGTPVSSATPMHEPRRRSRVRSPTRSVRVVHASPGPPRRSRTRRPAVGHGRRSSWTRWNGRTGGSSVAASTTSIITRSHGPGPCGARASRRGSAAPSCSDGGRRRSSALARPARPATVGSRLADQSRCSTPSSSDRRAPRARRRALVQVASGRARPGEHGVDAREVRRRTARMRRRRSSTGPGIVRSWGTIEPPQSSSSTAHDRRRGPARARRAAAKRISYGKSGGPGRRAQDALVRATQRSVAAAARILVVRSLVTGVAPRRGRAGPRCTGSPRGTVARASARSRRKVER